MTLLALSVTGPGGYWFSFWTEPTRRTVYIAVAFALFAWVFVPGLVLAILITAMAFINFGVDLLSNPHLRED